MHSLAMCFRGIFRSRDASKLEGWLDKAHGSGVVGMQRFARSIRRDIDAVRNAIAKRHEETEVAAAGPHVVA